MGFKMAIIGFANSTYKANLIWSFLVTNWRPLDLKYSNKLPFDMYSVTIFREDLSKMIPFRHTKFSCFNDLQKEDKER